MDKRPKSSIAEIVTATGVTVMVLGGVYVIYKSANAINQLMSAMFGGNK